MSVVSPKDTNELLGVLRALAENRNMTPVGAVVHEAYKTIMRLLAGDFTPEEIHNFCHKLPETVSAKDFASGCMAYQTQLYGSSPLMELLRESDAILNRWGISSENKLRARIREQIL